jgi:hypothetical protein
LAIFNSRNLVSGLKHAVVIGPITHKARIQASHAGLNGIAHKGAQAGHPIKKAAPDFVNGKKKREIKISKIIL